MMVVGRQCLLFVDDAKLSIGRGHTITIFIEVGLSILNSPMV
jgi:hypothetical protein